MKKHIQAMIITSVLFFGMLLSIFQAFLTYSKNEYKHNIDQLEQFGESEADKIGVNVNLPDNSQEKTDVDIAPPASPPENTPTPSPTHSPYETQAPTISPEPVVSPVPTVSPAPAVSPVPTASPEPTISPVPSVPPTETVFNGHIVAIDAGHQRKGNSEKEPLGPGSSEMKAKVSSGTTGKYTGIYEYVVNLDVALLLRDELENRGYKVVMIRETHDVNISNSERAAIANSSGAEIFIRIHCNGVDNSSVKGALTMAPTSSNPYVGSMASECKRLSQLIVDEYCAATGFKNMGIQFYDNMSGINWCKIPVTIIEMGFMTNEEDDRKLVDPNMQKKMAIGMANGIDQYFGL